MKKNSLEKSFIALENKLLRIEKMGTDTVAKNYKKVLDDLRISMSRLYSKYEIEGELTWSEMNKYNRLQKLDKEVYGMVTNLYKANSKVIKGTLEGLATDTYTNSIDIVDGVMKLKGISKKLPVEKIINEQMAGLNWGERVGKHRADLIYDIQKEIKQGLSQGDTYATMTNRLKKELGTNTERINAVIRTESHRVKAQAKEESFNQIEKAGVVFKKRWISSRDERVRGNNPKDKMNHVVMDGVIIPSNEDFVLPDGATGYGPGQTNSYNDINCRCVLVMVLDEEANKVEEVATVEVEVTPFDFNNNEGLVDDFDGMMVLKDMGIQDPQVMLRIDPEISVENSRQLKRLEERFDIFKKFDNVRMTLDDTDTVAHIAYHLPEPGKIDFNISKRMYSDKDKLLKLVETNVNDKLFMPINLTDVEKSIYPITHEYGHLIQTTFVKEEYIKRGWNPAKPRAFIEMQSLDGKEKWYKDALDSVVNRQYDEIIEIAKNRNPSFSLMDNISEYGASMKEEFFAEAFVNSQLGKPNEVGDAMNIWLEKKGLIK